MIGSEWVLHMSWENTCLCFIFLGTVFCHVLNSKSMGISKVMVRFWDISNIPENVLEFPRPWLFTGGFNCFFVHVFIFFGGGNRPSALCLASWEDARGQLKPWCPALTASEASGKGLMGFHGSFLPWGTRKSYKLKPVLWGTLDICCM